MTLAPLTSLGLVSSHTNLLATGQRRYAIKRGFCSANAEQTRSRRIPCPPPHSPAPQGVSSTAGCPILVAFFAARVGILILLRIITAAPQAPHKLPHRLRFPPAIPLNRLHNRAPHHHRIRKLPNFRKLIRIRNPESHRHRQLRHAPQSLHQFLRIARQLLPRTRHSRARHRIHKSSRRLRNLLQPLIRTGRRRQKHRRQIVGFHRPQLSARFFHRHPPPRSNPAPTPFPSSTPPPPPA